MQFDQICLVCRLLKFKRCCICYIPNGNRYICFIGLRYLIYRYNFLKVVTIQQQVFLVWWTTLKDLIHTWLYFECVCGWLTRGFIYCNQWKVEIFIYLLCEWTFYLLLAVMMLLMIIWWSCSRSFFFLLFTFNYARSADFIVLILLE